jgi:TolB-like protein/Flp pilus assembly protein TadD
MLEEIDVGDGEDQKNGRHACAHTVFLSHASQDSSVALCVCEALEHADMTCWIAPRDVSPGAFYADEIVHAIDAAKALVLILSQNAVASPHVLREVERAISKRHPVVSLRIDKAPLPAGLEYFLNTSQWLDASECEIARVLPRFVAAVRRAIETPTAVVVTIAPTPGVGTSNHSRFDSSRRLMMIVAGCMVAVVLAGLATFRSWEPAHRAAAPATVATGLPSPSSIPEKSVAVLPFVDMSEKHDQEYFSDGLAEELIDHLAHAADLKVIARTSSFQFKGKNEDMRTIGQRLGVANLLEGSVRTSGDGLRITAQLINVVDGTHRWSETYDRKMGDIFKVQDEIAGAVVAALKVTMASTPSQASARSANVDSYNELLRGLYFWHRSTRKDSELALSAYQRALVLDPTNADAWAGIAATYNLRGNHGWTRPAEAYVKAREAIDRALAIDPNLAHAHVVLAYLEQTYNHDFEAYRREYDRALQLDPSLETQLLDEGMNAYSAGEPQRAVQFLRRNIERDPLDTLALSWLADSLYAVGNLEEPARIYRQILEISPNFAGARCALGEILLAQHQPDAALAMMSRESDENSRMTCLPDALWVLGRRGEADALLDQVQKKFPDSLAYSLAQSYALRNDKEAAFKWLNRAYENREPQLSVVKGDPYLRNLHGDPRFAQLVRKLKLPE